MANSTPKKPEAQAMQAQPTARTVQLQPVVDSVAFVFMTIFVGASIAVTILYQ